MRPILLARHGECQWNLQHRRHGRRDSPLTPRGRQQALRLGHVVHDLFGRHPRVSVLSSPLGRARQTAVLLAENVGSAEVRVAIESRLQEIAFGPWEGLTDEQVRERFPNLWRARERDKWRYLLPSGGESYEQAFARVSSWLEELAESPGNEPVVAVSHQGLSRVLRAAYLGLEPAEALELDHPHQRLFLLADGRLSAVDVQLPELSPSWDEVGAAADREKEPVESRILDAGNGRLASEGAF